VGWLGGRLVGNEYWYIWRLWSLARMGFD